MEEHDDAIDDDALAQARDELSASQEPRRLREFVYACELAQIAADGHEGFVVDLDSDQAAIFNLGGTIYAISNICPHESSPLLASGKVDLDRMTVTCPLHGWEFEIPTGKYLGGSGCVKTYDVRVENGEVWIADEARAEPKL